MLRLLRNFAIHDQKCDKAKFCYKRYIYIRILKFEYLIIALLCRPNRRIDFDYALSRNVIIDEINDTFNR